MTAQLSIKDLMLTDEETIDALDRGLRDYDICACGDYRHQHENGIGKCRMPDDGSHGFKPCLSFRLSTKAREPTYAIQRIVNCAAVIKAVKVLNQARLINPIHGLSPETDSVKWQRQTDDICALLKEVSNG